MGASQRRKGKRLEREAVTLLSVVYPDARRSANQASGATQPDVDGTEWWVEVSGGARPNILAKLAQAERDREVCGDERPALVLVRRDHGDWTATVWLGDLLELLRRD